MLTFTQIVRNKELHAEAVKAAAARVTATVTKKPKWAFKVLALAGGKVEVFEDYTFASKWAQQFGGGVVYPVSAVADYDAHSVTLKDNMTLHAPEVEPLQLELI